MKSPATIRVRPYLLPALGAILVAGTTAVLAPGARAQQPAAAPANDAGKIAALVSPDGTVGISDVFIGRDAVGPYLLSWRGVVPNSEVVTLEARLLSRDTDYRLDPATGALTFTQPLASGHLARVDYRYWPSTARANNTVQLAPMQFNLLDQGNGALTLNALYRPELSTSNSATSLGSMLLGFAGKANLGAQSNLTSKLFLDARGGDLLDRSGLSLDEKTKTGFGQFSAGFSRAGSGFQASDASGITPGRQSIQAAGSLNPLYGIAASATFQQTTDLPAQGLGAVVTTLGEKLAGTLGPTTRIQATHSDTTTDSPDGTHSSRIGDRGQLDQKIGTTTTATALLDHTETASAGAATVAQTGSLTVRSQPTGTLSVVGSYQNQLLPSGVTDSTNLQIAADATKRIKLTTQLTDRFGPQSALHDREATVQYVPGAKLNLTGSVKVSDQAGSALVATGLNAEARPAKFLEITGGVTMREASNRGVPDPTVPDTYDLKVSVGLPKNVLKLTGGYTDNPDDGHGNVARARTGQVALQSTLGAFDLAGGYQLQEDALSAAVNTTIDLKLGWRCARATQILTTYRAVQSLASTLVSTDTYGLSLAHKVGSLLDLTLSGTMTTTYRDGLLQPNPDYQADMKLGLHF